ncbi:unnamed protein product [Prunus armeniaca]
MLHVFPWPRCQTLFRSRKAVTTGQSSPSPAQPAAITAPAQMEQLPHDPPVSHAPASSVAQHLSARRRHCPLNMSDTASTDSTVASGSQLGKDCLELHLLLSNIQEEHPRTLLVVEDGGSHPTQVTNSCISIGYDALHRVVPTAELHSSLSHDVGHVVQTYCPMQ